MNADPKPTGYDIQHEAFESLFPWWRPIFEQSSTRAAFLNGQRYKNQHSSDSLDRRDIQITGQETRDQVDHVVAKRTERPRSIEAKLRDKDYADENAADLSEIMIALVTSELEDPLKGWAREDYMAIRAARVERRGCVWMDKVDNFGPFGSELIWSYQPNGTYMYDPAYHPHHPLCNRMVRLKRMHYMAANRAYGVKWLRPDHESLVRGSTQWKQGIPLMNGFSDAIAGQCVKDDMVTIRETWIKSDPTEDPSKPPKKSRNVLKPADRYMSCTEGCGQWRSPTQRDLKRTGELPRGGLPENIPGATHEGDDQGCPACGGALERIDAVELTQAQLLYEQGRRLICVAPFCPNPDPDGDGTLYDGNWTIPTLRSFPARFCFASVEPGDNTGGWGDVDRMYDAQMASDQLMTMGVQRVFEHRDYWFIPSVGYINANNERFEFRDDDQNVGFKDLRKLQDYPNTEIEHIGGTGLDDRWGEVYERAQGALRSFVNKADIAPNPEATRDVAVGTAKTLVAEAEVGTEDFIRRDNVELSVWYGIVEDGIKATYTPERIQSANIEGTDHLIEMWGVSMPGFKYTITESPTFGGLDEAKAKAVPALSQAFMEAQQLGLDPLPYIELVGETNNLPKSMVRKFTKLIQDKMAAEQAAAEEAAMMGGAPGAQGSVPPDMSAARGMSEPGTGAPVDDGTNAAGIPSAVAA